MSMMDATVNVKEYQRKDRTGEVASAQWLRMR